MHTTSRHSTPAVPELDLPRAAVRAPAPSDTRRSAVLPAPIEIDLGTPAAPATKRCPVCTTELGLADLTCYGCGERFYADSGVPSLPPPDAYWRPAATPPHAMTRRGGSQGAMATVAELLPMGVSKRLLAYPLLAVVVLNLLCPCMISTLTTVGCIVIALMGGLGVVANALEE
ncbi:MAG: hypothetical protein HOO96_15855 [Polyangiaceae bacterium]|nr:hypothetical protein [Polyangiaceae bacterium]